MALPIPILDDKTWQQLSLDARGIIPPVSPQWTDFNVHDPGITFLELFAWLAEIQQYRLNRTSLLSFDRMLAIAGVTRAGLQPATVDIEIDAPKSAPLPANSFVVAVGKEDLPFATLHDTFLTGTRMQKVVTNSGGVDTVQTLAEIADGAFFEAFGAQPQPGDSMRIGFSSWFENQVRVTFTLYEDDLPPRIPVASRASGVVPSAVIRWDYLAGSGTWQSLPLSRDGTLGFSQSGEIVAAVSGPAQKFKDLYWIRATLDSGSFEIAPRIARIRVNVVRARQVKLTVNEDLGPGLGTPDQVVRLTQTQLLLDDCIPVGPFEAGEVLDWNAMITRLAHPPDAMVAYIASKLTATTGDIPTMVAAFNVLLENADLYQAATFPGFPPPAAPSCGDCDPTSQTRRLNRALLRFVFPDLIVSDRVEIQTGSANQGWTIWRRVDNFLSSGPLDRHYILDPQTEEIRFGNGLNGLVPKTTESIRARFYRTSRGVAGNLPAGQTWNVATAGGMLRASGSLPAAGGADPEPLATAQFRSRKEFRSPSRAITAADFDLLVRQTPGLRIAQVRVLPNFNPQLRAIRIPGDVTLAVLPYSNDPTHPPEPSAGFLSTVKAFVEAHRCVGTRLFVIGPKFTTVAVSGQLYVKKGASTSATLARAQDAVRKFLSPIAGSWPFGRGVFPSEIYQLLSRIEGVDYASGVLLNGEPSTLSLPPEGLPFPGALTLTAIPYEQRSSVSAVAPPCKQEGGCGCA
jgi:hypothetical protein